MYEFYVDFDGQSSRKTLTVITGNNVHARIYRNEVPMRLYCDLKQATLPQQKLYLTLLSDDTLWLSTVKMGRIIAYCCCDEYQFSAWMHRNGLQLQYDPSMQNEILNHYYIQTREYRERSKRMIVLINRITQIEEVYELHHSFDTIISPGKFENMSTWVPLFWHDIMMDSAEHEFFEEFGVALAVVPPAYREVFPQLSRVYGVALRQDEAGFVTVQSTVYTKSNYEKMLQSYEDCTHQMYEKNRQALL